jgi:hypothetical protein
VINLGGAATYFGMLGLAMGCVLIALVAVRRHIAPIQRRTGLSDVPVTP